MDWTSVKVPHIPLYIRKLEGSISVTKKIATTECQARAVSHWCRYDQTSIRLDNILQVRSSTSKRNQKTSGSDSSTRVDRQFCSYADVLLNNIRGAEVLTAHGHAPKDKDVDNALECTKQQNVRSGYLNVKIIQDLTNRVTCTAWPDLGARTRYSTPAHQRNQG